MILKQGIYIGKGEIYEETHAGIKMISQKYYTLIFEEIKVYKKEEWIYLDKPIDINTYVSNIKKDILQNRALFWIGKYSLEGKIVQINFSFESQSYNEVYVILSPNILIDENLKEYNYAK